MRVRRLLLFGLSVIAALSLSIAALIWAGPLLSGALFLTRPTGIASAPHDLPPEYRPKHRGHIDIGTGLYIREDDDFVLRRTPPFVVTRTYLSGDRKSRQFGIGTTDNAEWYLIGDPATFTWAELILADGGRIHFNRISRGTSYQTALFLHTSSPTAFYGARLGWTGVHWVMRYRDGSLATFQDCGPDNSRLCSLVATRDHDGHGTEFNRDSRGRLLTIKTRAESIAFEYDDHNRVVRGQDDAGDDWRYRYDAAGRLVYAADGRGAVRSYDYDQRDQMVTIREPGRLVENTFDERGRVIRQVTMVSPGSPTGQNPGTFTMALAYRQLQGSMTETDVSESDGTRTIYRFDSGYTQLEIRNADAEAPTMVSFARDPAGHFTTGITVRCTANGHRAEATAPINGDEEQIEEYLIRRTCRP